MPRYLVRMVLPILAALLISRPATARVILHKSYSSFAIHGHTAADLDRGFARFGPKTSNMARHPGATRIGFSGNLTYQKSAKSCRISKADVILTIKIILPRWTNRSHATAGLALLWDTLSSDIRRHEERHAEIALEHARRLDRKLISLSPESNCKTMETKAGRVTDSEIAAHDEDQRRFDRVEAVNFEARMSRLLRYHAQMASKNPKFRPFHPKNH
jgi:predicted secreted Zn-dependent protease